MEPGTEEVVVPIAGKPFIPAPIRRNIVKQRDARQLRGNFYARFSAFLILPVLLLKGAFSSMHTYLSHGLSPYLHIFVLVLELQELFVFWSIL